MGTQNHYFFSKQAVPWNGYLFPGHNRPILLKTNRDYIPEDFQLIVSVERGNSPTIQIHTPPLITQPLPFQLMGPDFLDLF
jgi:hypothetical protein